MSLWRRLMTWSMVVLILLFPTGELLIPLKAKETRDPAEIKRRVAFLGVGARVEVQIEGGDPLRGSIEAIEEDHFKLSTASGISSRNIRFDQVKRLQGLKLAYKTTTQPDPGQVRRVVAGLGKRKFINVKLTGGSSLDGRIQTIEEDHFTLSASKQGPPTKIAYAEVARVKGKMTTAAKVGLIGAIAGAAMAIMIPLSIIALAGG